MGVVAVELKLLFSAVIWASDVPKMTAARLKPGQLVQRVADARCTVPAVPRGVCAEAGPGAPQRDPPGPAHCLLPIGPRHCAGPNLKGLVSKAEARNVPVSLLK